MSTYDKALDNLEAPPSDLTPTQQFGLLARQMDGLNGKPEAVISGTEGFVLQRLRPRIQCRGAVDAVQGVGRAQ